MQLGLGFGYDFAVFETLSSSAVRPAEDLIFGTGVAVRGSGLYPVNDLVFVGMIQRMMTAPARRIWKTFAAHADLPGPRGSHK